MAGTGTEMASASTVQPADTSGVFVEYRSHRRQLLAGLTVFGLVVAVLGALYLADWYFYRPAQTVRAYFAALADGDAGAAQRLTVGDGTEPGVRTLDAATLRSDGYAPPRNVRIDKLDKGDSDDDASARVSFDLGGRRQTMLLQLRRDDDAVAGVFHRWRIVGGTYRMDVTAYGVDSVLIAGQQIPFPEDQNSVSVAALPGDYTVALPQQPLLTADPLHAYVGGSDLGAASLDLVPTIRDEAVQEVDRQVRAHLDECARSTSLSPPTCPFGSYTYYEVRNVHWRIVDYPLYTVELSQYQPGSLVVNTTERGSAEVTGTEVSSFGGSTYPYRDTVSFSVSGTVTASGGSVTWQPDPGD